jgi:hypothetical protein
LSLSVNLETAQQERSMLLVDDKRLLREVNEVDSLCNQKKKSRAVKTDFYQAQMHVYLARTTKEMHMKSDMFGLSNTKHLCRNTVLDQGNDVVLRWWTYHLIT